ncbi:MAG: MGMT family protein [Bacilli bacterium]|nr:MGMT family protein [Bacilli bacterium]MBN2876190.1 MGMT family protein [Bacilli bacterium]
MTAFTEEVIRIIQNIPKGKVMTYGQIATCAGNPWGARQISRILHSMTNAYDLPWFRVINSKGEISLNGEGAMVQMELLAEEGVIFESGKLDLEKYLYRCE